MRLGCVRRLAINLDLTFEEDKKEEALGLFLFLYQLYNSVAARPLPEILIKRVAGLEKMIDQRVNFFNAVVADVHVLDLHYCFLPVLYVLIIACIMLSNKSNYVKFMLST